MIQHVDGIVRDDPEIADMRLARFYQAVTDTRLMDFDANEVGGRVFKCLLHQRIAIAESDLKSARRIACEKRHEIERHGRKVEAEVRPQLGKCALLRGRHTAGSAHEASNCGVFRAISRVSLHGRYCSRATADRRITSRAREKRSPAPHRVM